ncbi:MAG: VOC family protein [Cyclobacteriaceae bacterium]|nr:VOC family protein [Cyclobacteriaceae bacterium]
MRRTFYVWITLVIGTSFQLITSCADKSKVDREQKRTDKEIISKNSNPVVYFEIPVIDIDRAIKFYQAVFEVNFNKEIIDNNEMALFPFENQSTGISGALAKGEIYKPTKEGVVIYFKTDNIDETLERSTANGGQILYPKTDNGIGFVAEFEDTEGNRIALFQVKQN